MGHHSLYITGSKKSIITKQIMVRRMTVKHNNNKKKGPFDGIQVMILR